MGAIPEFDSQGGTVTSHCVLDLWDDLSLNPGMDTFWLQVDRLAAELGVAPATRKKWRQRKAVPGRWHLPLVTLAERRGESLSLRRLMSGTEAQRAA